MSSYVVAPDQEPGEFTADYIARLERLKRPDAPVVFGRFSTSKGFHKPSERRFQRTFSADMFGVEPSAAKRTAREKLKALTDSMLEVAEQSYRLRGFVALPRSVVREVVEVGRVLGMTLTEAQVESMTLDAIRPLMQTWAERVLVEHQNRQGHVAPISLS